MEKAHAKSDPETEAKLDADFHMAILDASHNVIMLHMMRSMYDLLQEGVFYNRQMMFRHHEGRLNLMDQHRRINTALQSRDPMAAKMAVHAHLDYVADALRDQQRAELNDDFARLKMARENG